MLNDNFFWLSLARSQKRGNVALRKVENTHHDPKYKLESSKLTLRKMREESHSMHDA